MFNALQKINIVHFKACHWLDPPVLLRSKKLRRTSFAFGYGSSLASLAKPAVAKGEGWSGRRDSNSRPPAPKAGALPDCATPRLFLDDAVDSRSLHCTAREKARFVVAAKKEPHQPFGQLLQRRSDLLRHLPKLSTLREVYQPVASPLEKLPEGVMRSLSPTGLPS